MLKVSVLTVHDMIDRGDIDAERYTVKGLYRIPVDSAANYCAKNGIEFSLNS